MIRFVIKTILFCKYVPLLLSVRVCVDKTPHSKSIKICETVDRLDVS